jgi:ubiquitin carboxyl-terminal hydrolase 4/11
MLGPSHSRLRLTIRPDSSVSQRQPESAITSAAYLLFYRRRTEGVPLGPPAVKSWFNKYWDPKADDLDSEASSRAESPSSQGKGQRLGGQTSSGSSSALVVAGAGRRLRGGEGGSAATHGGHQRNGKIGVDGYDADADADGEEDETLGMEFDDVPTVFGPELPPKYGDTTTESSFDLPSTLEQAWGWNGISIPKTHYEDADGDNDSNQAYDGDEEIGGADVRLVEAFGDELDPSFAHQNSPIMQSLERDVLLGEPEHDLEGVRVVDQDMISADEAERGLFEVEAPVAEVRVGDVDEDAVDVVGDGVSHAKKE